MTSQELDMRKTTMAALTLLMGAGLALSPVRTVTGVDKGVRNPNADKRRRKANRKPVCGQSSVASKGTDVTNPDPSLAPDDEAGTFGEGVASKLHDLTNPDVVIGLVHKAVGSDEARKMIASEYREGRKDLFQRAVARLVKLDYRIDITTARTLIFASIGMREAS
jgi:hypothetical protein